MKNNLPLVWNICVWLSPFGCNYDIKQDLVQENSAKLIQFRDYTTSSFDRERHYS
jgi:hypothetical protein